MKARVLDSADVLKIVDLLREQGCEVFAPFGGRGRDTCYDKVTDQNRGEIQIHLPNPYYPPKRFIFPHIERLMKVQRSGGGIQIEPTYREPKRAIFGIRSCDVAGLQYLERYFSGELFGRPELADGPFMARRAATTALSTSTALPSEMRANGSSWAGSITSSVLGETGSTHLPSM